MGLDESDGLQGIFADNVDLGTNMLVLFLILILDLELWGSTMVGIVANKNSLI